GALPGPQRVPRVLVAPVLPQELRVQRPRPEQVRVTIHVEEEELLRVLPVTQAIPDERRARQRATLPARGRRRDGLPRLGVLAFLVVGAGDRRLGGDLLLARLRHAACEPRLRRRARWRVVAAPLEVLHQILRERPAV